MPKKIFQNVFSLLIPLTLIGSSLSVQAKVLNGNVNETDVTGPGHATMGRSDIPKNDDPFAGSAQQDNPIEQIEAPKSAFAVPSSQPPPPSKMFPLNAQDEGQPQQPNFTTMAPQPDGSGIPQQPQQSSTQTNGNPNDPDGDSQAMQIAWEQWHHNVAQAVYQRFAQFSNMAFSRSPALSVSVAYTVSRDCQISNIRLSQKSPNFLFNTLILTVIKSLNGDVGLLTFPQGSRRMSVDKSGTFSVNTGIEGFKYTTGDKETLRRQRGQ
jgi:hypothetical protein